MIDVFLVVERQSSSKLLASTVGPSHEGGLFGEQLFVNGFLAS